ncbi:MAG: hypothetical protein HQ537_01820 [Parcubacteria group bacterium]|nr:hypothetical protein [Parcubacteria group bacterium]
MTRIFKHQVKALRIYKDIQQTKKEFLKFLEKQGLFKQLEKKYEDIIEKEKMDYDTARILKRLFTNSPAGNAEKEKMDLMAEIAVSKAFEKLHSSQKSSKEKKDNIILKPDGDLCRGPHCYPMRNRCQLLNILKTLNKNFKETKDICTETGIEKTSTIRRYIGAINARARYHLKLSKNKNLIESKSRSGYRINSYYKLIKKR